MEKNSSTTTVIMYGSAKATSFGIPRFVNTVEVESDVNTAKINEATVTHSILQAPTIRIASDKYPYP